MPPKQKAKAAKIQAKKAENKPSKSASKDKKSTPVNIILDPKPAALPLSKVGRSASKLSDKNVSARKKADSPKKATTPPKVDAKRSGPTTDDKKKDITSGVKKTKSDEQIVKVITKGGAAVDSLVPNK